jgi:replication-associated recombination protein RarA
MRRAFTEPERGYGGRKLEISDEALEHLAQVAGGDARTARNALELAVESTQPTSDGITHIDLSVAKESIQRRLVRYDKGGDEHYNTISAFIKSVRGSDPNAALHLRDASYKGATRLGHGKGYEYPHSFSGHHVAQQYLPDSIADRRFYEPSDQSYEREVAERLER